MPQAVTVYRWDDPGAPQIVQRRPSELIAILKRCLVEGYGAKAPLGWSVLFEDTATHKIIFQNSIAAGGSGGVLRVFTGNTGNAVDANTFFTPAQSVVDIDNLFRPGRRHKMMFGNTDWRNWILIGTATAFYFMFGSNGRVAEYDRVRDSIGFFGDFNSILPNDVGRFIALVNPRATEDAALSNNWPGWQDHFSQIWYGSNAGWWTASVSLIIYAADGRNSFRQYNSSNIWGTSSQSSALPMSRNQGLYTPIHISMSTTVTSAGTYTGSVDEEGIRLGESLIHPLWRGYLPGAIHEAFGRYSTQNWPITEELNGHNHFLIRSATTVANCWINMEEWP